MTAKWVFLSRAPSPHFPFTLWLSFCYVRWFSFWAQCLLSFGQSGPYPSPCFLGFLLLYALCPPLTPLLSPFFHLLAMGLAGFFAGNAAPAQPLPYSHACTFLLQSNSLPWDSVPSTILFKSIFHECLSSAPRGYHYPLCKPSCRGQCSAPRVSLEWWGFPSEGGRVSFARESHNASLYCFSSDYSKSFTDVTFSV